MASWLFTLWLIIYLSSLTHPNLSFPTSHLAKVKDVCDCWCCCDNACRVLLLQPLHEHLHVQHPQEPRSESRAQSLTVLLLNHHACIIQCQLLNSLFTGLRI